MHPLIRQNQDAIGRLCREYGVRRLEVFGSAARGVDFDPARSDVDFLVEVDPRRRTPFTMADYMDFREALSALLGRPVDLVLAGGLRNPYRQAHIDASREVVHGSETLPAAAG